MAERTSWGEFRDARMAEPGANGATVRRLREERAGPRPSSLAPLA
jgi:hypothetical protein